MRRNGWFWVLRCCLGYGLLLVLLQGMCDRPRKHIVVVFFLYLKIVLNGGPWVGEFTVCDHFLRLTTSSTDVETDSIGDSTRNDSLP